MTCKPAVECRSLTYVNGYVLEAPALIGLQHTEFDWPLHEHPAACVIAQQYSSATFVSLRFQSRIHKFGARLKMPLLIYF